MSVHRPAPDQQAAHGVTGRTAVNLLIYGDSLAFRRPFQPDNFDFTYPFQLAKRLEGAGFFPVNLMVRSRGGALTREMLDAVKRDSGYFAFRKDDHCLNIAVVQLGVVDCAPVPFTYPLRAFIAALPKGEAILRRLRQNRPRLQRLWSFSQTSEHDFRMQYSGIIDTLKQGGFHVFAMTIPTPSGLAEARSPGFARNAIRYSTLIEQSSAVVVDFNKIIGQEDPTKDGDEPYLIPEDGHHLTPKGHAFFAKILFDAICRDVGLKGQEK